MVVCVWVEKRGEEIDTVQNIQLFQHAKVYVQTRNSYDTCIHASVCALALVCINSYMHIYRYIFFLRLRANFYMYLSA